MEFKDYYKILGVDKGASEKEIKQTYRKLARQFHPDINPGKEAEAKFKEINEAYEVLGDKEKRAKYDNLGNDYASGNFQNYQTYTQGANNYQQFDFDDVEGFSDFFKIFFGASGKNNQGFNQDFQEDISLNSPLSEYQIEITLKEAIFGAIKKFELNIEENCPVCYARGRIYGKICANCHGRRKINKSKVIEVKIPSGVRNNSKIRLSGEGIILNIKIKLSNFFELKGKDLYCEIPISIIEAVLGSQIEIPTPRGKITMKIPPETQGGKVFRLKNQGIPPFQKENGGDLYIKTKIVIPINLSTQEKEYFQKLAGLRKENPRNKISYV